MKQIKLFFFLSFLGTALVFSKASAVDKVTFKASDGLEVIADLYMVHDKSAPFILLFHQASWSRGEYIEIAPKLNAMGYNCMAVDQRSGGSVNGIPNLTKQNAVRAMKETQYLDAYADLQASLFYVKSNLSTGKLILWGSSYSAALVLKLAGERQEDIDAVVSFSPGEYFARDKSKTFIQKAVTGIDRAAVFITSMKNEKNAWWAIYEGIPSDNKQYYLPETTGDHGAKALWKKSPDSMGYWKALKDFLTSV